MSKFKKYEKYKNTEFNYVGDIPLNWDVEKVKQILQERNKKNNPVISKERLSLSIDKGVTLYSEKTTNLDRFKEDFTQYKLAYINDLVLNSMNMIVGASGISKYFGCVSPAYYVLYSRDLTKYNPRYFAYFFKTQKLQSKLYSLGKGIMAIERGNGRINTCRLKVPRQDLKNLYFPVPPIEEQNRIVDFITYKNKQIDNIINRQKKIIKLLEEKKRIIVTNAITKGIDNNISLINSHIEWIGEMPSNYKLLRIKSFSPVLRGASPRPIDDPKFYDSKGDYSWVRIGDVSNSKTYLYQAGDRMSKLGCSKSVKLEPNNLFLSICASVGKPCITQIKCCIHDGFVYFPKLDKDLNKFFYYLFSVGDCYKGLGKVGTQLNLNTSTVGNIKIPYLDKENALKIVEFLDNKIPQIEIAIDKKHQLIEKLEEYKKILISNAVTGQIDIRDYEIKNIVEENIIEDDLEEQLEDEELNEVEYANN